MSTPASAPVVKVVGANGQISLGKHLAGRQVLIEEQEPGVWLVRTATVIPDNERWLHEEPAASGLREAMDWAQSHPPSDEQADATLKRLRNRRA
ncbi:hypothetical protein [Pigmentiphaga soli]